MSPSPAAVTARAGTFWDRVLGPEQGRNDRSRWGALGCRTSSRGPAWGRGSAGVWRCPTSRSRQVRRDRGAAAGRFREERGQTRGPEKSGREGAEPDGYAALAGRGGGGRWGPSTPEAPPRAPTAPPRSLRRPRPVRRPPRPVRRPSRPVAGRPAPCAPEAPPMRRPRGLPRPLADSRDSLRAGGRTFLSTVTPVLTLHPLLFLVSLHHPSR